jgi:ABC-type nitrate/sulfonate/bicarbonate transport system permease component
MRKNMNTKNNYMKEVKQKRLSLLRKVLVPIGIIVVWIFISRFSLINPLFIPTPKNIVVSFSGMAKILPKALFTTVSMTLVGFTIGSLFGTITGLLMAYSRAIRDLLGALLDFTRPVPVFALIPLFILWFGIGRAPQIVLIALGSAVILGVTTLEAIKNVPTIFVRAALTMGANRKIIYRTIIVPSIIPHLIGAIRVAAAASWGLDVAAEFMGSQQGLGYLIILQQTYLRTAGILLLVAIYSVLAVILDTVIALFESKITRWTERHTGFGIVASMVGSS